MDETTRAIVDFARRVCFADLSAVVVHECKRHVVDSFAACLAALDSELGKKVTRLARRRSAKTPVSVWGTGIRSSPEAAAFANGVLVRHLDMNDTYVGRSRGHPSDVLPAVLGAAELTGASGPAVIEAMVVAYDLYCSFIDSVEINTRGWDQPLYGVVACAAAAGKLMQLDDEHMGHAIALALVPNLALAQTRSGELSEWKSCAGANAARNALFAVELARDDFTGPDAVFEGAGGLFHAIGHFDWVIPQPGAAHFITSTHLKSRPVCFHGQSCVEATLMVCDTVHSSKIASIEVETYRTAIAMMADDPSRWQPGNRETADHSIPFAVATVLVHGDLTLDAYDAPRLADAAMQRVMQSVRVRHAADLEPLYPQASPARVTARLGDGTSITRTVSTQLGHHRKPLSDAAIEQKFCASLARLGEEASAGEWLSALWQLDQTKDVRASILRNPALEIGKVIQ